MTGQRLALGVLEFLNPHLEVLRVSTLQELGHIGRKRGAGLPNAARLFRKHHFTLIWSAEHQFHCRPPCQIAAFNSFAARKAIFLLALILMASPVAGLRPMRAGRLRTCKMPRPLMRMRRPLFRCPAMASTMPASMSLVLTLGSPWLSARSAARWRSVTVSFFTGAVAFCMRVPRCE